MKKNLLILFIGLIARTATAQIDTVRIQVDGLTCSSCSKAVEEKLLQIDFISAVRMNLNYNEATVLVDFSKHIDWETAAKAVYKAGFSVGAFYVPACARVSYPVNGQPCAYSYFYIGDPTAPVSNGYVRLVGKYFMDKKTYRSWAGKIPDPLPPVPAKDNKLYYYF